MVGTITGTTITVRTTTTEAARTTNAGWLAAMTAVPGAKNKRRVSCQHFFALRLATEGGEASVAASALKPVAPLRQ
jgi:hypothetical protein